MTRAVSGKGRIPFVCMIYPRRIKIKLLFEKYGIFGILMGDTAAGE